ncbi:MAG: L-histidine N(alpha)-methyltransferase [Akkermansiaceae bacterium]|nr:L-histidine N(alpha)-methyltransferase [Verrucomicrobiales bacterium]
MPSANVTIHSSQFPENVRRDLLESLRSRRVNHKFHYDSLKQTQQWLALHQAHSPSRHDADCAAIYERGFIATAKQIPAARVHLIGLGCGGGQKDTRLLRELKAQGKEIFYTPSDVSSAMVLVARQAALSVVPGQNCFPLVCDLATAEDLAELIAQQSPAGATRLFTFFGMIPNFEPESILSRLAALVRPGDWLLFSANLAPGSDYDEGMRRILPQYDNALTHDWLLTFLLDLGVERSDGELRFGIEADEGGLGLKRVSATFQFTRARRIQVDSEQFDFGVGETIRLFFSYRYTPTLVEAILPRFGFRIRERWITASEEEGVFLLSRQ